MPPSHESSAAPTPTAPGRLPLIGHGHHLARQPLEFMDSLRHHGSVVRILIGPTPAYVLTDPALTRRVLVTEAGDFAKGGKIIDALRVFFGDGLATVADGEVHMRHRRLMQPMFNKAHIATRGDVMIDCVRSATVDWSEGTPRQTYEDMNELALKVFLAALFGTDLPAHLERDFSALMPAIMRGAIRQTLLPPWFTRLPLPANRAHRERVQRLRTLIDQAIDHHTTSLADQPADVSSEHAGLFAILLTAHDDTGALSRQQLQDEAITLLTGAIETTGTTLAWALYEIARNPEVEQRLHQELGSVCGNRPLRYDDLDRLVYTRRILHETLRMYGPAWLVTRTATRSVTLDGHLVPQGADVVYSPYLHQHDPEVFPDPSRFDPDRWDPAHSAPGCRASFLAFGDGRRKCIGENFAWTELMIILATITQHWRLTQASAPPRPQAIVTVKPDALSMTPCARRAARPAGTPSQQDIGLSPAQAG